MVPRFASVAVALLVMAGCAGSDLSQDQDVEAWFVSGCGEVLLWAQSLPSLPQVAPTVGGLETGPVVQYTEELGADADSLILRLESLGPPGDPAGDRLYAELLASLADVSTGAEALADEYRPKPAIPLTDVEPIIRRATDLSAGVARAFRAFGRDPDVGPIVVEIESCQAVGGILG